MSFQIHALPASDFAPLFDLNDQELSSRSILRRTVAAKPGAPCRVTLEEAEVGEQVLLLPYEHLAEATPYRASHAIYVRRAAQQASLAPGVIPEILRTRLISLRAFDAAHMMIDADVVEGVELEAAISRLLDTPSAAYLHLHFAKRGCFAAKVTRT